MGIPKRAILISRGGYDSFIEGRDPNSCRDSESVWSQASDIVWFCYSLFGQPTGY
jgi:hypothetical protein